jgi:high-affinity iron transporter
MGAALATIALLNASPKRVGWAAFFRISEAILLCLGAALLIGGLEKLIGLEHIPAGIDPLWDSSALLDDSTGIGNWLASLAGYRALPSATLVAAFVCYWLLALTGLRLVERHTK